MKKTHSINYVALRPDGGSIYVDNGRNAITGYGTVYLR